MIRLTTPWVISTKRFAITKAEPMRFSERYGFTKTYRFMGIMVTVFKK